MGAFWRLLKIAMRKPANRPGFTGGANPPRITDNGPEDQQEAGRVGGQAMPRSERMSGVDTVRFIALIAVVVTHAAAYNPDFRAADILSRFAVPFFFCTSGYFVARAGRQDYLSITRFLVRICAIFGFWCAFYMVAEGYDFERLLSFHGLMSVAVNGGPGFHLWFLSSLALCAIIYFIMMRFFSLLTAVTIASILYVIGLLLGPYCEMIFDVGNRIWNPRNGPFFGLLFFVLGACFGGRWLRTPDMPAALMILLAGAAMHFTEISLLEAAGYSVSYDLTAGVVPLGLGFFLVSLNLGEGQPQRLLARIGRYGLGSYALHLMFLHEFVQVVDATNPSGFSALVGATVASAFVASYVIGSIPALRPLVR